MDILNAIFSKPEYKIPVEFDTDDFKEEVRKLLSSYIKELEEVGVSENVIEYVMPRQKHMTWMLNLLKKRRSSHTCRKDIFSQEMETDIHMR
ncbi:hypothetical protein SAMN05660484_00126 [Eubacterium ruminantium]|uniref:Uncharacterized protein n=1 Tax=Eubacterium ruminantium TaxID=42322 RepID=A0A1T4K724_9FIRM|nr:hypothetical protein [Eubacterium ruminantium]SCW27286.1 hypothetical protein SAMN05660484_00126 [Eubacterium ruminantium]SDM15447.1 hypothetical protein SAMN04490370_101218 [Eubacterium ruminantium]SJZ38105.1 hypothetical protein SAMN02745110_00204 [Eubacterium ruminantium]